MSKLKTLIDGFLDDKDAAAALTEQILDLIKSTGTDDVIHQIGPGKHRLIVNGKESPAVEHTELIVWEGYTAATDAFRGIMPQLSKVYAIQNSPDPLEPKKFKVEAVQRMN
jgi:hypothetical protein